MEKFIETLNKTKSIKVFFKKYKSYVLQMCIIFNTYGLWLIYYHIVRIWSSLEGKRLLEMGFCILTTRDLAL